MKVMPIVASTDGLATTRAGLASEASSPSVELAWRLKVARWKRATTHEIQCALPCSGDWSLAGSAQPYYMSNNPAFAGDYHAAPRAIWGGSLLPGGRPEESSESRQRLHKSFIGLSSGRLKIEIGRQSPSWLASSCDPRGK